MPRETLTSGITIEGEHFSENVEIGTPHYALQHSEEYYPSPFKYDPGRWIADEEHDTSRAEVALAESAFCAFSVGPRSCVGKTFAYQELMSVLARLLWQFDMRLKPGSTLGEGSPAFGKGRSRKDEYQLWDTFASKNDGPLVEFRARTR